MLLIQNMSYIYIYIFSKVYFWLGFVWLQMECYKVKLQVPNSGVAEVTPMTRVPHSLIHQAVFVANQGQLLFSWAGLVREKIAEISLRIKTSCVKCLDLWNSGTTQPLRAARVGATDVTGAHVHKGWTLSPRFFMWNLARWCIYVDIYMHMYVCIQLTNTRRLLCTYIYSVPQEEIAVNL